MYNVVIPSVYRLKRMFVNPFFFRISIISLPCGKAAIDSGRYSYALCSVARIPDKQALHIWYKQNRAVSSVFCRVL